MITPKIKHALVRVFITTLNHIKSEGERFVHIVNPIVEERRNES